MVGGERRRRLGGWGMSGRLEAGADGCGDGGG